MSKPRSGDSNREFGKVYLVGSGPGDPELLTLKGKRCLQSADVVLYDGLANPATLRLAAQAEWICVGKHGKTPIWDQKMVNARVLELALEGKTVVRLKGGDTAIFARSSEELENLDGQGIAWEVVPGVTAASAAFAYAGIPLTHRDHASAVAFVTGQQKDDGSPLDFAALASFPGTLVIYMGVTTAPYWSAQLIQHGKSPDTPVAVVRRCSHADQIRLRCKLSEVGDLLSPASKMRPPVIIIIGPVAALESGRHWFIDRPLRGVGVLNTRPPRGADHGAKDEFADILESLGANVFEAPLLRIEEASVGDPQVTDAMVRLREGPAVDGIAFTSARGVTSFFRLLRESGLDARALSGMTVAAVGPKTANRLAENQIVADTVPGSGEVNAQGLLSALPSSLRRQRWIAALNAQNNGVLIEGLRSRGADVLELNSYRSAPVEELPAEIIAACDRRAIQYCTVTSPMIAETAARLLQPFNEDIQPVSLSPAISGTLASLEWPAAATADEPSAAALAQAILRAATPAACD